MQLMVELLNGRDVGTGIRELPHELVIRESVAAIQAVRGSCAACRD